MESSKEILLTQDIAKAVAEELGISNRSAREHIEFLTHWIKTLAEKDEVCQIQIPHVGHIYPNVRRSQATVNRMQKLVDEKGLTLSNNQEKVKGMLQSKADFIRSKYPDAERNMLHGDKARFSNPWHRAGKGTAELEKFQNGY